MSEGESEREGEREGESGREREERERVGMRKREREIDTTFSRERLACQSCNRVFVSESSRPHP